jgi:hypothetical protein
VAHLCMTGAAEKLIGSSLASVMVARGALLPTRGGATALSPSPQITTRA